MRHAWQRKSTQKHGKNTQVVLIGYSFFCSFFSRNRPIAGVVVNQIATKRSVTKLLRQLCKYMRGRLRGLDLNHRLLSYEPSKSMTRLCLSMIYVEVDLRFSTLFWGILFSTCSSSCSRILAQRWPNDVGLSPVKSPSRVRESDNLTAKSPHLLRILSE